MKGHAVTPGANETRSRLGLHSKKIPVKGSGGNKAGSVSGASKLAIPEVSPGKGYMSHGSGRRSSGGSPGTAASHQSSVGELEGGMGHRSGGGQNVQFPIDKRTS